MQNIVKTENFLRSNLKINIQLSDLEHFMAGPKNEIRHSN